MAQFGNIDFRRLTRPYIDTVEKAQAMVQQINEVAEAEQIRPIVFDTIVNADISDILSTANALRSMFLPVLFRH